jgi:hypothetical protein
VSRALKLQLRAQRAALRAQIDNHPHIQKLRAKRARRRQIALALIAALLLLLLLLQNCPEGHHPPPLVPPPVVVVEGTPTPTATPPKHTGNIKKRKRPPFVEEQLDTPPWLPALRLQVAARSPRLAKCFAGVDRPGSLRWTATIDGETGTVFEQELSTEGAAGLTVLQRKCVLSALESPTYKLVENTAEERPTPARVSLLLEF